MKKEFGKYYLGFDIGTDSIGWAVTDEDYKVLKINGKSMWGTHLFESGQTAAERRMFRCARRRTARRKERMALLSELFREEINKVDKDFFQRLEDSKFWQEDKRVNQKNTLFFDESFTDIEFHKQFPTIYHLRSELIHSDQTFDIRLVYLALHHIMKHRGHFLYEGQEFKAVTDFDSLFYEMLNTLTDYGIDFGNILPDEIKEILKNEEMRLLEKKKKLKDLMNADSTQKKAVAELLAGSKVSLASIFDDSSLEECEIPKISFSDGIDEVEDLLTDILQDKMYLIHKLKALYDWGVLSSILQGSSYLSEAKKRIFEEHKRDLSQLKAILKKHQLFDAYKEIFKSDTEEINYSAYIGKSEKKNCGQKDFCSYILKKIKNIDLETEEEKQFLQRVEESRAFPKQVSKENSVIPYQLNLYELEQIIQNAERYLPFLKVKDKDGLTVSKKLKSLFVFKIPYYVGPLNPHSQFAWVEKITGKESEKIYPWNFDEIVDKEKSADQFILRMTNQCTYLRGQDVLPKQSVLYSKFNILNQLNNIRIDGEKMPVAVKQSLYMDLFCELAKPKKVTKNAIQSYFKAKGMYEGLEITGIDTEIPANLKSLIDFKRILGEKTLSEDKIDEIIQKIVILGESKTLLKNYLVKYYSEILSEKEIIEIVKLNYSGWGRLSKAFLEEVYHQDKSSEIPKNIITMLWETDCNLMQLLSGEYGFMEEINRINKENRKEIEGIRYSLLEELYVSPAVRRSIWRTLLISKEIQKITGHEPEKIFIEMARGGDETTPKGKRTTSRKEHLKALYLKCDAEKSELLKELELADEGELRDNRLYLYYTQLGRCMYSGERINLSDLYSLYDIDHIYPQSKVKDESIHANKVLVKKTLNGEKDNLYPIPEKVISNEARKHWAVLLKAGFITKEKFNRLSRKTPFSEAELSGFIARQLVETRQSTKAVANIMKEVFKKTEIVYVKAENVSDFRQKYDIVKSRKVNDFHHAKDAYLNIVVGNVYHEKFTLNPVNFIRKKVEYSLNKVFDFTIKRGERIIWDSQNSRSLTVVKKQVEKNNVLFTRYAYTGKGMLFDQMPVKAGKGQFPLKTSDERMLKMDKYGAYNKVSTAYFCLLEHKEKGKIKRSFEYVPVYLSKSIKSNQDLIEYAQEVLELKDVRVLLPKVKINTLFCYNGFRMHLSARSNSQLVFKGAMPLVLNLELYSYAKKIEKYIERNREKKIIFPITDHQGITVEKNIILYDELVNKLKSTIYNVKLSTQVSYFEKGRIQFMGLSLAEQCELIYNALSLFDTSAATADLSLIKGPKTAGKHVLSCSLNAEDKIYIINQSITGIFESEQDLNCL